MTAKENISSEIKKATLPLLICNWIFGIGILEYPLGQPRRLISGLYIASNLIIYCLLAIYSYQYTIAFSREIEANDSIANVFFANYIFLTISTVLLGWHRSRKIHCILERGITTDQYLQKIETKTVYQKTLKIQLRKQLIHLLIIATAVLMINFTLIYKKKLSIRDMVSLISFNYPLVSMSVVDATFFHFVHYSKLKFKNLNDTLKNTLTTSFDIPQYFNTIKYFEKQSNTEDESSIVNTISDQNYTISMARLDSYHVYSMMGTVIIYNSIKIYLFTKCCNDVIQETLRTGDILSKLYEEMITKESKNEGLSICVSKLLLVDELLDKIGVPRNYAAMYKQSVIRTSTGLVFILSCITVDSITILSKDMPLDKKILTAFVSYSKKDNSYIIETSRKVHLELVEASQMGNALFGLQLILSIAVTLIMITSELYNASTLIRYGVSPHTLHVALIVSAVWMIYYGIKMYVFSWTCTRCTQNANETGDVIAELYDELFISSQTRQEIREFNVQLIQDPLKFTAYGFVNLDYTLIHGMIASITTYLMILIQLDKLHTYLRN
ncbi:uncharacterized protein LOC131671887 [Phymastichus coffea]|uniref:uncharacterized protein LOC131671887 n=1 Tax=Phymastichus coffea TaxID=108790 RepID=UPI00273B1275|nr:uncharacterized protein LOC131671887 [Phymastichus coffea]